MTLAYIALGSNLGDRRGQIDEALRLLALVPGVLLSRLSSYYETDPQGGPPGQGKYLNAAVELETTLTPHQLLAALQQVEMDLGRVRTVRDGPRTIDLDLLLHGDSVCQERGLMVPHPRMHLRTFVLGPLVEIAPLATHPVLGRSVAELASALLMQGAAGGRPLAGRRALVTGSTGGIGRAIAQTLAAHGADVIVHGRRHEAGSLQEALAAHGGRTSYVRADLCDPAQCLRLADVSWNLWNGLDLLVNNAGADVLTGAAAGWSFDRKLQELLAVDLAATMSLSRTLGARMKDTGRGVILNMGWDQAETGMEGDSGQLFAAVKGAVMAFTKSLALSLAPEVRVNCLAPGWIRTAWAQSASASWQERALREAPLARWGTAQDVADAAAWLASDQASFVTGQVIRINGGAVR